MGESSLPPSTRRYQKLQRSYLGILAPHYFCLCGLYLYEVRYFACTNAISKNVHFLSPASCCSSVSLLVAGWTSARLAISLFDSGGQEPRITISEDTGDTCIYWMWIQQQTSKQDLVASSFLFQLQHVTCFFPCRILNQQLVTILTHRWVISTKLSFMFFFFRLIMSQKSDVHRMALLPFDRSKWCLFSFSVKATQCKAAKSMWSKRALLITH